MPLKKKWTLVPTRRLCALAGVDLAAIRAVHVAGTNGKGSVAAMLHSILRAAGYSAGLYTSPHLVRLNERIVVGGRVVSDAEFARLATLVGPLLGKAGGGEGVSYFEMNTVMAFRHFLDRKVDYAVVEAGMGGRLDSSNVITPLVTVVTGISLDHTQALGGTVEKIAGEKAGVIKPGGLVVAACTGAALRVVREKCRRVGARLITVGKSGADVVFRKIRADNKETVFEVRGMFGKHRLSTSLRGGFQAENAATAFAAAKALESRGVKIGAKAIAAGLRSVKWPGRLETVSTNPLVVLDGAHNPAKAAALADALREVFPCRKKIVVLGIMADKDIPGIVRALAPVAEKIIATRPRIERAAEAGLIAREAKRRCGRVETIADVEKAVVAAAAEARGRRDAMVVVTGSLYLVGEAKKRMGW